MPVIAELARNTPAIVEGHRVTGEDCFIMKMPAGRVELLDEALRYGNTTSPVVQSTPVPLRAPPLPAVTDRWRPARGAGAGSWCGVTIRVQPS